MKTAISVDDELMREADEAARDLGLSRSGLVAVALRGFLQQRRQSHITEQLNKVYTGETRPEERELVRKFRTKMTIRDRW